MWISDGSRLDGRVRGLAQDWFAYPVVGDFTGDGADDMYWVRPGGATESWWDFDPTPGHGLSRTVRSPGNSVADDRVPVAGDFDGDGVDDILWYGAGPRPDVLWRFRRDGGHSTHQVVVSGTFVPLAGDFDGNGVDDILWYGPGSSPDVVWHFRRDGTRFSRPLSIAGWFTGVVGDFDGNAVDDIVWYG